jgi:hypothetical protein
MKAILEFNLPEDNIEYELVNNAGKMHSVLWDMDQWLRGQTKHAPDTMSEDTYNAYLIDQVALEFRHDRQHAKNHASRCPCGVDGFRKAHQIRPLLVQTLTDGNGVLHGTGEAGERIHHQHVAALGRVQRLLQGWPVVGAAPGESGVGEDGHGIAVIQD